MKLTFYCLMFIFLFQSCKEEIHVKMTPYVVKRNNGFKQEFTFIGIDSMSMDNSLILDDVLHELSNETPIEANIIGQIIDVNDQFILIKKDSLNSFVAQTSGFSLSGKLKDEFAIIDAKVTQDESSKNPFGVEQDFNVEFSNMIILNKFDAIKE